MGAFWAVSGYETVSLELPDELVGIALRRKRLRIKSRVLFVLDLVSVNYVSNV